jgi:hypothetical protein
VEIYRDVGEIETVALVILTQLNEQPIGEIDEILVKALINKTIRHCERAQSLITAIDGSIQSLA